jgi:hypothetical protein
LHAFSERNFARFFLRTRVPEYLIEHTQRHCEPL